MQLGGGGGFAPPGTVIVLALSIVTHFNTPILLQCPPSSLHFESKIFYIAPPSNAVLKITVGHWQFSDQFQHLADQNPFWSAKFTVGWQLITYKMSYFKKWPTNFWPLFLPLQCMYYSSLCIN